MEAKTDARNTATDPFSAGDDVVQVLEGLHVHWVDIDRVGETTERGKLL